jgi:putative membrane protein
MKELLGGVDMMHHGYWMFRGIGPKMWGFMGLHILAWVFVAVVLFWLYRRYRKNSAKVPEIPTALDILKKRYAQGEITKEEFELMKEQLK